MPTVQAAYVGDERHAEICEALERIAKHGALFVGCNLYSHACYHRLFDGDEPCGRLGDLFGNHRMYRGHAHPNCCAGISEEIQHAAA